MGQTRKQTKSTMIVEMENTANDFLNMLNENEPDKINSEKRKDVETQIFWESENLIYEKQQRMGISVTMEMEPNHSSKEVGTVDGEVRSFSDNGDSYSGVSQRLVNVERKFWMGNRQIRKYHDVCDCRVHLLKTRVDEENRVACPNCGATGELDQFMEGCSFCGSRFTIQYFQAKVAGFSLIESMESKMAGITKNMIKTYVVMFLALFLILMIVPHSLAYFRFGLGFGVIQKMFFTVYKFFFLMFFTVLFSNILIRSKGFMKNESVVTAAFPSFDFMGFMQDLEYRLRAIYMADDVSKLQAVTDYNLEAFIREHENVFDVSISNINFLEAFHNPATGDDCISVEVTVKMYRLSGKAVRECYENLTLNIAKHRGGYLSPCAIRQFKCEACGNNLHILKSTKCDYCGHEIDKFSLGWTIQGCSWKKRMNYYRTIPKVGFVIALVILLL